MDRDEGESNPLRLLLVHAEKKDRKRGCCSQSHRDEDWVMVMLLNQPIAATYR